MINGREQPEPRRPAGRRWIAWALFWGWWTAFGILTALPMYFRNAERGAPLTWWAATRVGLADLYSWALVALATVWLARRLPLEPRRWPAALAVHLVCGTVLLGARFWLTNGVVYAIGWIPGPPPVPMFFYLLPWNLWMYLVMAGAAYGFVYYQRFRERELDASRLETQLAHAQLDVLKMQLHPHFLFNTLHAVSALMDRDVVAARRMITRLSGLLRLSLQDNADHEVPLEQEIEFLNQYVDIQRMRFGERLAVEFDVEREARRILVPRLLLQPLVENSIQHGIARHKGSGRIVVSGRLEDGRLCLQIHDNGPALLRNPGETLREGIGLGNTRARLTQMYRHDHRFSLENAPQGGVVATIEIPARTATAAPPSEAPYGNVA